jgi:hypothetical protein
VIPHVDDADTIHRDSGGRTANLVWTHVDCAMLDAGLERSAVELGNDGTAALRFAFKQGVRVARRAAARGHRRR